MAIKDLNDKAFFDRFGSDRFTASVLSSKYRNIVQRTCRGLLNTAFSVILRDWYDFAAAISGPPEMGFPQPAMSDSLLVFLGTMPEGVANIVNEFGIENLQPGDVLVCNDPYRKGTHINDNAFIRPVFYNGKIVAFASLLAHLIDMGGTVPAGFSGSKLNIYENGVVIPPTLLYRDDQPVKSTWKLYADNTRFFAVTLSDMLSMYQNLLLAEKELLKTIDKYDLNAFWGAMKYACDISEESMRTGIAQIPDGDYEATELIDCDGVDDSEEYTVHVKIKIRQDKAEFDLSGTSRQARTCINASWLDTKTAVLVAMKWAADPKTPITSASMKPIDIVLPEGTIVSAMPPDGAVFMYWEAAGSILYATWRALEKALGEDALAGDYGTLTLHSANGIWPEDSRPWITMAQCGGEHGPLGANKGGDADSYILPALGNGLDPATEAIELDVPTVVLRKEYITDTAGPGKFRGGASVARDTYWLTENESYSIPLHYKQSTGFGVYKGKDAKTGGVWKWEKQDFDVVKEQNIPSLDKEMYKDSTIIGGIIDPETKVSDRETGEYFYALKTFVYQNSPGTIWRYITTGGGGYGDALEREVEAVKRDVRNEYVSIKGAKKDYGVVIQGDPHWDPENLAIDLDATRKLRTELKKKPVIRKPDYLERRKGPEGYQL